MVFERPHHQHIAAILGTLDADTLRRHACWFGGGMRRIEKLAAAPADLDVAVDRVLSCAVARAGKFAQVE